jgi:hypothetical protein
MVEIRCSMGKSIGFLWIFLSISYLQIESPEEIFEHIRGARNEAATF